MKHCLASISTVISCLAGITALLPSCTTPDHPEYKASAIIERVGGQSETPKWSHGEKVMWQEGGEIFFVHTMQMDGDNRPEACMKAAALESKTEMLRYIKEAITSSGQVSEMGSSTDPAFESLTAFLSQGTVNGVAVKEQYWEKMEVSETSGERRLKVRCASKVAVKRSDLERQLREASSPKVVGNPKIRDSLINAQKDFLDNVGKGEAKSNE